MAAQVHAGVIGGPAAPTCGLAEPAGYHGHAHRTRLTAGHTAGAGTSIIGSGRRGRAWTFAVALVLLAAVLVVTVTWHLQQPASLLRLPFAAVVPLFYLCERAVVEIRRDSRSTSFSFGAIALVACLFLTSPGNLLIGAILANAVVLIAHRHRRGVELLFNLAQSALVIQTAVLVFHAADGGTVVAMRAWIVAILAVAASVLVGAVLLWIAVAIAVRRPGWRGLARSVADAGPAALGSACFALVAVSLVEEAWWHVWFLVVPLAVLFVAYRGYIDQRRRFETVEFVHLATIALHDSPNLDAGLLSLLGHARDALGMRFAQVVFLTPDGTTLSSRAGSGDDCFTMHQAGPDLGAATGAVLADLSDAGPANRGRASHQALLACLGARSGLVAPLATSGAVQGVLVLGDPLDQPPLVAGQARQLVDLLANQIKVALERGRLEESLLKLIELEEQLKHQAYHDPLTGLANRALFADRVTAALSTAGPDTMHAVLLVDLDDFKTVNDSLGHAAGDELLEIIARRISAAVRPGDLTARIGGDEFAVLLESTSGPDTAEEVAARVLESVRQPAHLLSHELVPQGSIGIALADDNTLALGEILRNADMALYRAKSLGKGRFAAYEPRMHREASERLELRAALAQAVDHEEFVVCYQPIYDLDSTAITGAETLVRWVHPVRGVISPSQFIHNTEETGLIVPLGFWVLEQAISQLAGWRRDFPEHDRFSMNVNVSARQLAHPDFVGHVRRLLAEYGIPASRLVLELTESVLVKDSANTVRVLSELKSLGVRLAIDDFGTGFSSLIHVHRLPIDLLKIDRSFIGALHDSPSDSPLVGAIVQLSDSLGLGAVAEGIETREQLAELRRLGCSYGQGFLLGVPMTNLDLARRLGRQALIEMHR